MKKILLLMMVLSLTSCQTLVKSSQGLSFSPTATVKNVDVELVVDNSSKITASSSATYLFGLLKISGDNKFADGIFKGAVGGTQSAAAYRAVSNSGADVLVNPQYTLEKTTGFLWLWTTYESSVTGYKGNYKL
jgi:hypothetical protein